MRPSETKDPLIEWNRLNKENAEQDFASALFISMANTSPIVDKFSVWLLAGTGATGALLITQISTVIPKLTVHGFQTCLLLLVVSAVLGFLAKHKALRCQIQMEIDKKLRELIDPIFEKHEKAEEEIQEYAKERGLALETEISFENVINEFQKPFPFYVKWLINRNTQKNQGNRQAGYQIAVVTYFSQLNYTFFQAIFFLLFLCSGAWFATSI